MKTIATLVNYSCKTFIKLALGSLLTSLQSYENNLKLFVRVKVCETLRNQSVAILRVLRLEVKTDTAGHTC